MDSDQVVVPYFEAWPQSRTAPWPFRVGRRSLSDLAMGDPQRWGASTATDPSQPPSAPAESYSDYLQLPALLALQQPLALPAVHDEMLFIIVHQTHELWFKQILCELSLLISDIDGDRFEAAGRTSERVSRIARLLAEHMLVLDTMPVLEFQRFRAALGTASGLESEQFQRLGQLAGLLPAMLPTRASNDGLDGQLPSASVREAFWRALERRAPGLAGIPRVIDVAEPAFGPKLAGLLAQPELAAERNLAEALLALDEHVVQWRRGHHELVKRMIGAGLGTGGSSGAQYLRATMDRCFFPELWRWRAANLVTLDDA
jgi:tryptophan 2,3-dioxygenase